MPTYNIAAGIRSRNHKAPAGSIVTVTPAPGSAAFVEYTTATDAAVANNTATWAQWPKGEVGAATSDIANDEAWIRVTAIGGAAVLGIDYTPSQALQEPLRKDWFSQIINAGQGTISSSGATAVGQVLTAVAPTGVLASGYQWYRDTGAGPVAISGATGATYTRVSADVPVIGGTSIAITVVITSSQTMSTANTAYPPATPSGVLPAYLGQVATGTYVADQLYPSVTQQGSRSAHTCMATTSAMSVIFPNWYMLNQVAETAVPNAATIEASIEYPAGTYTRLTFGGVNVGTPASGANLISDLASVSIPIGAKFWIRVFLNNASGLIVASLFKQDGTCQFQGATSGVPNYVMGGGSWTSAGAAGTGALMYTPIAIVGMTTTPAVMVIGDSRGVGLGDSNNGTEKMNQGYVARAFGASYPCGNMAVAGDRISNFITNHAKRLFFAQYYTHVVITMGINDTTNTDSAATIQANTNTLIGYFTGKKVAVCTMEPYSNSTDSFATVANQTPDVNNPVRVAVNTQRKTNLPLANVVYDLNIVLENILSPEDGKWKVGNTADGLHANVAGNAVAAAGINVAAFVP